MCPAAIHAGTKGPRGISEGVFRFEGNKKMCIEQSPFQALWERGAPAFSIQTNLGGIQWQGTLSTILTRTCLLSPHLHSPSKTRIEEKERISIDSLSFEPASMYQFLTHTQEKILCHGNGCSLLLLVAPKIDFRLQTAKTSKWFQGTTTILWE